jgi:hypothetical protein
MATQPVPLAVLELVRLEIEVVDWIDLQFFR